MNARGVTKDVFQVNTMVVAYGYSETGGTPEVKAEWIELDGKQFHLRRLKDSAS
jgi:hypothetical protein